MEHVRLCMRGIESFRLMLNEEIGGVAREQEMSDLELVPDWIGS